MRSIYKYVTLFLLPFVFFSCEQENTFDDSGPSWEERWIVGSETVDGYDGMICLWIKRDGNPVWEMTDANVEGFKHEEGYEYTVDVRATVIPNPPLDGSEWRYSLIRIISKEKKKSDVPLVTTDLSKCSQSVEEISYASASSSTVYDTNGIMRCDSLYILQGDILLTESQANAVETRSGCLSDRTLYWPNNTVYYTYADGFSGVSKVTQAISEWQNKTSLTFVYGTGSGNYIEFFNGNGNWSCLGMTGGKQPLSLSATGSTYGSAIHEIGHAVGLIHEQCRNDRDSYINIHTANIIPEKLHNFNKYSSGTVTDVGTFDFGSVMLYSSDAFTSNGNATMTTKSGLVFEGQRTHLSSGDVQGIAAMYGPPFHKLVADINVITDEVSGLYETYETEVTYTIKIYQDKACTTPTSLTYPRSVTIYKHHVYYNPDTNRMHDNVTTTNVTLSAGTSTYLVDRVRNIEKYTMSNPDVYDVTTYSVSPYNNISQVY